MARVQYDEAHALQDALLHALHDLVCYLTMAHVTPPREHVGRLQDFLAQPVLGLVERGHAHHGPLPQVL